MNFLALWRGAGDAVAPHPLVDARAANARITNQRRTPYVLEQPAVAAPFRPTGILSAPLARFRFDRVAGGPISREEIKLVGAEKIGIADHKAQVA
jgi:hypothetical protein